MSQPPYQPYQPQQPYQPYQPQQRPYEPTGYVENGQLPPQPQSPVPMGTIRLTTQGNMWLSWIVPTVTIDGAPTNNRYGTMDIPVPAGPHRVEGYVNYLWQFGKAMLDVMVAPGTVVPVYYASPMITFMPGSIGHAQQSRNGVGCYVAILAMSLLVLIGAVGLIIFAAAIR